MKRDWDYLRWGVLFSSRLAREPYLIGCLWAGKKSSYAGEPARALLFSSRKEAREWCREKMREWKTGRADIDRRLGWRVRPVRVRETVRVVE